MWEYLSLPVYNLNPLTISCKQSNIQHGFYQKLQFLHGFSIAVSLAERFYESGKVPFRGDLQAELKVNQTASSKLTPVLSKA